MSGESEKKIDPSDPRWDERGKRADVDDRDVDEEARAWAQRGLEALKKGFEEEERIKPEEPCRRDPETHSTGCGPEPDPKPSAQASRGKIDGSEGVKFDGGKNRMSLIPPAALEEIARVFTVGAMKYAPFNWAKGMAWSRVLDALERHLIAWKRGVPVDAETGLRQLAQVAWGCIVLLEYERLAIGTDDRWFPDRDAVLRECAWNIETILKGLGPEEHEKRQRLAGALNAVMGCMSCKGASLREEERPREEKSEAEPCESVSSFGDQCIMPKGHDDWHKSAHGTWNAVPRDDRHKSAVPQPKRSG